VAKRDQNQKFSPPAPPPKTQQGENETKKKRKIWDKKFFCWFTHPESGLFPANTSGGGPKHRKVKNKKKQKNGHPPAKKTKGKPVTQPVGVLKQKSVGGKNFAKKKSFLFFPPNPGKTTDPKTVSKPSHTPWVVPPPEKGGDIGGKKHTKKGVRGTQTPPQNGESIREKPPPHPGGVVFFCVFGSPTTHGGNPPFGWRFGFQTPPPHPTPKPGVF